MYRLSSIFTLASSIMFFWGCEDEKHYRFEELDINNIPYVLHKSKESIIKSTFYEEESIYVFRQAFDEGTESCIQIRITADKSPMYNVIYYEYDLVPEFGDNLTRKLSFANKTKNPSVNVIYTKIKKNGIPEINKLPKYSRKGEDEFMKKHENSPNLMFRYFFFLPKENSFYELRMNYPANEFDKDKKPVVDWLRKLTKSMSYKEQYYFDLFTTQTEASTAFWQKYRRDPEFYKKIDSLDYAIPSKELDFFMPRSIYGEE